MNQPTQSNQIAHLDPDTLSAYHRRRTPTHRTAGNRAASRHLPRLHPPCPLRHETQSRHRPRRPSLRATTRSPRPPHRPTPFAIAATTQPQPQPKPTARIYSIRPAAWAALAAAILLAVSLLGWRQLHPNQHPRRRTARPAPRHSLQRRHPAGHLHRPSHRQTLVPGPSPLQLQPPRRHRPPPRHHAQRRRPHLPQRSARRPAPLHHPQTRGLRLPHAAISAHRRPQPPHPAEQPGRFQPPHRHHTRPAHHRRQRRQPSRPRQPRGRSRPDPGRESGKIRTVQSSVAGLRTVTR